MRAVAPEQRLQGRGAEVARPAERAGLYGFLGLGDREPGPLAGSALEVGLEASKRVVVKIALGTLFPGEGGESYWPSLGLGLVRDHERGELFGWE